LPRGLVPYDSEQRIVAGFGRGLCPEVRHSGLDKKKLTNPFSVSATFENPELQKIYNQSIFHDLSWNIKLLLFKEVFNAEGNPSTGDLGPEAVPQRRVPSIESLVQRRQDDDTRDPGEDDNNMRLKLFRLMYETVRDSDLKCKRAELIRTHYENSTTFEIGYLMGDVMDKFNIMSDITMTLKRLFREWKPIEHINAYEQIANQAIEINHLIDIMRGMNKKNETSTPPPKG
ncbi:uncharacterized protein LOC113509039, partial [Trichoplusia ni]|uniref:Uncharacterized protein LOC113509039 n=1 Tax=Trichoplusia ni TaxID=7111 RepID=A0A7E5X4F4_TRINI